MNASNVKIKREGTFTETKHMRNALKLRSVILDNNCLGKIKQLLEKGDCDNYSVASWLYFRIVLY